MKKLALICIARKTIIYEKIQAIKTARKKLSHKEKDSISSLIYKIECESKSGPR